jgi:hypothetical protein
MHKEKELRELIQRLSEVAGDNLVAAVLYGSAADHEFHEGHSDLNVLCLVRHSTGAELTRLQPVCLWWLQKGHPAPLIFTLQELHDSADVFAIELLDMKQRHVVLFGEDFLNSLDVPMSQHRLQVERELRTSVVRLRQAYLSLRGTRDEIAGLMTSSASTFATLFRHALIALGQPQSDSSREASDRLAAHLGLDLAAFHIVLDMREGKRHATDLSPSQVFAGYLDAVVRVADEMDRRLAAG